MNKTKIEWTDYSWNPITGCLYSNNTIFQDVMKFRTKKQAEKKIEELLGNKIIK